MKRVLIVDDDHVGIQLFSCELLFRGIEVVSSWSVDRAATPV